MKFEIKHLQEKYDYPAPDGSEIRLLPNVKGGGLCHCTLPIRGVSKPVCHRTVDEIWYFLQGEGQVWRKYNDLEKVDNVTTGVRFTIPVGTQFQFRNTGDKPLLILIATMPPWPGLEESIDVDIGKWL